MFSDLEKIIGVKFKNIKLLKNIFIHRSYLNESRGKGLESNERLEFLGDAVLELITTEYLYLNFPNPEGELTNWRSALVKGENLAKVAETLNLNNYLQMSHGEEHSGGRNKKYILANTMEALIGGIYLDRGFLVAKKFITKFIIVHLKEIIEKGLHIDAKSHFQELAQEKLSVTPVYQVLETAGPDHAKNFTMGVYLKKELIGTGSGVSKQAGEQAAAKDALKNKKWI